MRREREIANENERKKITSVVKVDLEGIDLPGMLLLEGLDFIAELRIGHVDDF